MTSIRVEQLYEALLALDADDRVVAYQLDYFHLPAQLARRLRPPSRDPPTSLEAWAALERLGHEQLAHVHIAVVDSGLSLRHADPERQAVVRAELVDAHFAGGVIYEEALDYEAKRRGHGVAVASVIVGQDKVQGIVSKAPGVQFTLHFYPHHHNGLESGFKNIMDHMANHESKMDVVNMSFGAQCGSLSELLIHVAPLLIFARPEGLAWKQVCDIFESGEVFADMPDTIFVVAAGNEGADAAKSHYPAALSIRQENVITVGAINHLSWSPLSGRPPADRSCFSNHGEAITVGAEGTEVYALNVYDRDVLDDDKRPPGVWYSNLSGTSVSAPIVTGVVALVRAVDPTLTPQKVKELLIETGDIVAVDQVERKDCGDAKPDNWASVNAGRAVAAAIDRIGEMKRTIGRELQQLGVAPIGADRSPVASRPTATPTPRPTATPTLRPTATPTPRPTATPTPRPTATPTPRPTATPTPRPTATPTPRPTAAPAPAATAAPTAAVTGTLPGALRLTFLGRNSNLVWSRQEDRIAFLSDRHGQLDFYVMNADGSGVTRLTEFPFGRRIHAPTWSPDETTLAFAGGIDPGQRPGSGTHGIYLVSTDGTGSIQQVTAYDDHHSPVWSPDGSKIAFKSGYGISVMDAGAPGTHQQDSPRADICQTSFFSGYQHRLAWTPDSSRVMFLSTGALHVMNNDCSDLIQYGGTSAVTAFAIAPDGTMMSYSAARDGLYVVTLDPLQATQIIDYSGNTAESWYGRAWVVSWSPSEQLILFYYDDLTAEEKDGLYLVDLDLVDLESSDVRRIADILPDSKYIYAGASAGLDLAWSPDGRFIAFAWNADIYVMPIDP